MPAIKVCGICNLEDAEKAVELGAEYLGFIFAPSPRQIDLADARSIRRKLKGRVNFVGVYKNQDLQMINDSAEAIGLDFVQLHGDETPDFCGRISRPVFKAIELFLGSPYVSAVDSASATQEAHTPATSISELAAPSPIATEQLTSIIPNLSQYSVHAILFDRPKALAAEETWLKQIIQLYADQMQRFQPFFIAGGLNAGNVQTACSLNPFGLDVASGVESEPGKKDHNKLESFFQAVQGAKSC